MDWSVDKAITEFENLSHEAFSKRQWLKVPMFRHTAQLLYSYRFKSEGIDSALQKAFGQGLLFGFNESSSSDKVKVGVVSGVSGIRRSFLFSNYSRNSTGKGNSFHSSNSIHANLPKDSDYLEREENPKDDLKIWEA